MSRHWDWPRRLHDFIESRRNLKFAWGSNDCVMFPADGAVAMGCDDFAAPWRGQYATEFGAARILADLGGLRHLETLLPAKDPRFAQRGDVVVADMEGRETGGLCIGSGMYCAPGEAGIVFRPMLEVILVLQV